MSDKTIQWRPFLWKDGHDDYNNEEHTTDISRKYIQNGKKRWPRAVLSVHARHYPHMEEPYINVSFSTKASLMSWWEISHDGVPLHLFDDVQEMIAEMKEKIKLKIEQGVIKPAAEKSTTPPASSDDST